MSEPAIGSRCMSCKHILEDYTCTVFPKGMPPDIANGFDHSFSIPGDNGVIWEQRDQNDPPPDFIDISMEESTVS